MVQKDIDEKKQSIASLLAKLALEDDAKNEESLKLARKALERMTETFNDLNQQLTLLQEQRKNLEKDFHLAETRELPAKVEAAGEAFNKVLAETLSTLEILRKQHEKLREHETAFSSLQRQYQESCVALGVVEPFNPKVGLGELAVDVPSPWAYSVQLPNFDFFRGELRAYKNKLEGWKGFTAVNPDWEARERSIREAAGRPFVTTTMMARKPGSSI